MQWIIDREKLEEHRNEYPSYNWEKILGEIKKLGRNFDKGSKRKFKNQWFITTNVSVSLDCKQLPNPLRNWTQKERWTRLVKLQSGYVEVNLSELFKASKGEQHLLIAALGDAKGTASEEFKDSYENDTIKGQLTRYLKRLSKRKIKFLTSCIIMTTPVTTSRLGMQQNTNVTIQHPVTQPDNSPPMPTSSTSIDNRIDSLPQFESAILNRDVPDKPLLPKYHFNHQIQPTSSTNTYKQNHPSQHRLVEGDYEQVLFTLTNALDHEDDEYVFSPVPFDTQIDKII